MKPRGKLIHPFKAGRLLRQTLFGFADDFDGVAIVPTFSFQS